MHGERRARGRPAAVTGLRLLRLLLVAVVLRRLLVLQRPLRMLVLRILVGCICRCGGRAIGCRKGGVCGAAGDWVCAAPRRLLLLLLVPRLLPVLLLLLLGPLLVLLLLLLIRRLLRPLRLRLLLPVALLLLLLLLLLLGLAGPQLQRRSVGRRQSGLRRRRRRRIAVWQRRRRRDGVSGLPLRRVGCCLLPGRGIVARPRRRLPLLLWQLLPRGVSCMRRAAVTIVGGWMLCLIAVLLPWIRLAVCRRLLQQVFPTIGMLLVLPGHAALRRLLRTLRICGSTAGVRLSDVGRRGSCIGCRLLLLLRLLLPAVCGAMRMLVLRLSIVALLLVILLPGRVVALAAVLCAVVVVLILLLVRLLVGCRGSGGRRRRSDIWGRSALIFRRPVLLRRGVGTVGRRVPGGPVGCAARLPASVHPRGQAA